MSQNTHHLTLSGSSIFLAGRKTQSLKVPTHLPSCTPSRRQKINYLYIGVGANVKWVGGVRGVGGAP
jgi:hypothetical protein